MSDWYDRSGRPITMQEYGDKTFDYHRVASTDILGHWVSTVWLGLDHGFGSGPPLIFETMVFRGSEANVEDFSELYADRYSTEAAAAAGHDRAIAWVRENYAAKAIAP